MTSSLADKIISSAFAGLQQQGADGAMAAGHNGPWNHHDTPVRTTAHWAIVFHKAFSLTQDQRYLDGAVRACEYLIQKDRRPYGYTFICRYPEPKRSQSNGLVGQAWAVEPLLYIGSRLREPRFLDVAREVILLHDYDYEIHGWKTVEIDGSVKKVNKTLNQQVWFSAMVARYGRLDPSEAALGRSLVDFLEHLPQSIQITEKGSFVHEFQPLIGFQAEKFRQLLERKWFKRTYPFSTDYLATGYNSFVLYGLGMLREFTNANAIWRDTHFQELVLAGINFSTSELWNKPISANLFAYGYNPVGIELAYAITIFSDFMIKSGLTSPTAFEWLESQFSRHFDYQKGLMVLNTSDSTLLAARIYEAVRILEAGYETHSHDSCPRLQ